MVHFLQLLLYYLESNDIKTDTYHGIFQISFPSNNADQAEDNTTNHADTYQDLTMESYKETSVENQTHFSFNEQERVSH